MMYVYWIDELPEKVSLEDILNNNNVVLIDDEYLLSKQKSLNISGMNVNNFFTFEEYILNLEDDRILEIPGITFDFSVSDNEVLKSFTKQLYCPINKDEKTYAEIIFDSDNPRKKIKEFINLFLVKELKQKIKSIQKRTTEIKKEINKIDIGVDNGEFLWD